MVFARRHFLAIDVKVVASNAVQGGHRASIVAGVSDGGDGGQIVNHLVVAAEAFVHQTLEAALAKLVIILGEIVPTHLVNDDAYHQLGALHLCSCHQCDETEEHGKKMLFHLFSCVLVSVF